MAEFPSLPLWTDAFLGDTIHLNAEETGAYLMLLIVMWRTSDCALPDDDVKLARWARCSPRQWARIKPTILEFMTLTSAGWEQKRLKDERRYVEDKRTKAAENGRASALKRKGRHSTKRDASDIASDEQTVNETPTPTPTTHTHVSEEDKPLPQQPRKRGTRIAEDFIPVRPYPESVQSLVDQWPQGREWREFEQFRDYWLTRTTGATKSDWDKTWHNRIRDQHDRIVAQNRNGNRYDQRTPADGLARAIDAELGLDQPSRQARRPDPRDSFGNGFLPLPDHSRRT